MENLNNQHASQGQKHPQTGPTRDINEYAERHRRDYDALNNVILGLQGKLARAVEERMDPIKAQGTLKGRYTEIIESLKAEIAKKETERDNLHTRETIH